MNRLEESLKKIDPIKEQVEKEENHRISNLFHTINNSDDTGQIKDALIKNFKH